MAALTDPARELADVAENLTQGSNKSGAAFLSEKFDVGAWSTEFVKIIACIMERADLVASIVKRSTLDPETQRSALNDLTSFKNGFVGSSLNHAWNNNGSGLTAMKDHGRPLQYLSPTVRPEASYPKLTKEEVQEFIHLIDAYLGEVRKSDEGPDFVRQSIIEGLTAFRFQLEKIGWMGSGYALVAFREVMFVYDAAKWHFGDDNPNAEAMLRGMLGIIKGFKSKVDEAKGWAEAGKAVWNTYTAVSTLATPLLLSTKLLGG